MLGAARLPRLLRPVGGDARRGRRRRARAAGRRRRRRGAAPGAAGAPCSGASAAGSRRCRASTCPTAASTRRRCSRSASAARCSPRWPRCSRSGPAPAAGPASARAALILLVTLYAVPAVVLDFEGEFLRGALLARARARLPAAGAAPGRRRARPRGRGRRGRGRGAARRAAARRARAVVGLRALGGRHRRGAGRRLQLGPQLLAAGLAARRPRDAPRQGAPGARTGRRATSTSSTATVWRAGPAAAQRGGHRATCPRTSSRAAPGPSRWTSRSATWSPTRSSPPASRPRCAASRATRSAAASSRRRTGSGRATRTRPTSTRRGRPTGSCAQSSTDYEDWLRLYRSVILPRAARHGLPGDRHHLARVRRRRAARGGAVRPACPSTRRSSAPGSTASGGSRRS